MSRLISKLMFRLRNNNQNLHYFRGRGMRIGDHCEILNGWDFGSEPYLIEIGDYVRITSGVKFVTHDGGVWVLRNLPEVFPELADIDLFGRIKIGNNVHIGFNAVIMPGVTIGDNCIIGCGCVLTHDVPAGSIVVGVPGRVIKTIDAYAEQHIHDFMNTKFMSPREKRKTVEKALFQ